MGDLDLLGEVAGGGTYESPAAHALDTIIEGQRFRYVSLGRLIALERAAGRTTDLNILAELEALADDVDADE